MNNTITMNFEVYRMKIKRGIISMQKRLTQNSSEIVKIGEIRYLTKHIISNGIHQAFLVEFSPHQDIDNHSV